MAEVASAPPSVAERDVVRERYRVEAELGRGGMGVVYRAVDETTGERVALKRLLPDQQRRTERLHLFEREYRTLSQLSHPSIIRVYDYGVDDRGAFYTMELLEGSDLRSLAPLEPKQVCRYLRDVASSLAQLHARRLIHRDVSPTNVRLSTDGRAKLIDFGALMPFGFTYEVIGTASCIAPEVLQGVPLFGRAGARSAGRRKIATLG